MRQDRPTPLMGNGPKMKESLSSPHWAAAARAWLSVVRARRVPLLALFLGVLAPLWAFGALAEDVWQREGFAWDAPILLAIHRVATPEPDRLAVAVTMVGGARGMAPMCLLALGVLLARRRWRAATFVALAYGGAVALDALAKAAFRSARPHLWVSPAPETGYGFPSGHAMGSMALLAALVILAWPTRGRWLALLVGAAAVTAIGLSRLYLGVHYPSDVLGAWAAALAWVIGLRLILAAPRPRVWRPAAPPAPPPPARGRGD